MKLLKVLLIMFFVVNLLFFVVSLYLVPFLCEGALCSESVYPISDLTVVSGLMTAVSGFALGGVLNA